MKPNVFFTTVKLPERSHYALFLFYFLLDSRGEPKFWTVLNSEPLHMLLDYCWKCRMKTREVRANHLAATSSQVQLLDFSPNTNRCYVPVPGEDNDEDEEENDG